MDGSNVSYPTEFVWCADFIIHNENGLGFYWADNSGGTTHAALSEIEFEQFQRQWLAEQVGVEPEQIEFIRLTWSSMPRVDA